MNLVSNARKPTWCIWAENSPYETKDVLKARGYRWVNPAEKQIKAWHIDIADTDHDSEEQYLKNEIYHRELSYSLGCLQRIL